MNGWLQKSAEADTTKSFVILGHAYHYGNGVLQDFELAANLWRKAAERGDADAQRNLGEMYRTGEGVTRNLVEAYAWLNVAATNGSEDAAESKTQVARSLIIDEVTQAQKLSREMVEANPKLISE